MSAKVMFRYSLSVIFTPKDEWVLASCPVLNKRGYSGDIPLRIF